MKIKKIIMVCALIIGALFVCPTNNRVDAAGVNNLELNASDNELRTESIRISQGSILYDESSGVTELDEAKDRTDSLIEWICRWIGGTVAVVSLIVAAFMAGSHQTEQRNQALVVMVLGIVIFFAPQIIDYLLGRS